MHNRIIKRGNVLLAFDLQTGLVAYFDEEDYDLAVEANLLNKRNYEGGIFNNMRYPIVKGKTVHRYKTADKRKEGDTVHHINELAYDNRASNLALVTREEHANIHNVVPFKLRDYWQTGKESTDLELINRMRADCTFDDSVYNPLTDMSYCQDYYFGYIAGLLTKDEFLVLRLKFLAQNPFIIYYFGLNDLCDKWGISYNDYFLTEWGSMHSKYNDCLELYVRKTFTPSYIFRQDVLPRLANLQNDDEFLHYYYYFMRSCNIAYDLQFMYHNDYFNEYFEDKVIGNREAFFKINLDEAYQRFVLCKLDETTSKSKSKKEIASALSEQSDLEEGSVDVVTSESAKSSDEQDTPEVDLLSMSDKEFDEWLFSGSKDSDTSIIQQDTNFLSEL